MELSDAVSWLRRATVSRRLRRLFGRDPRGSSKGPFDYLEALTVERSLRDSFSRYRSARLSGIGPEEFFAHLHKQIGSLDVSSAGFAEKEIKRQRDLSLKFHWGHNHDFGTHRIPGRMGDRHLSVLANLVTLFPIDLEDFRGSMVLDVGCWTGGTTLVLANLGSQVVAVEEVKKYAAMTQFLVNSFDLRTQVTVVSESLYSCTTQEYEERFDIAYLPGVIYHLSDPLVGLRILFNALKVGGVILIESAGIRVDEPLCRFDGSLVHSSGRREDLDRSGWNWFVPSPSALDRMMEEAGFSDIQTLYHEPAARLFAFGRKTSDAGICRAGLSVPGIR